MIRYTTHLLCGLAIAAISSSEAAASRPDEPVPLAPVPAATAVPLSPMLEVTVEDPDLDPLTVSFYGRPRPADDGYFTLLVLPDTQYYTGASYGGTPQMLTDQTQWAVDNLTSERIAFVSHVGDCVDSGDNGGDPTEWEYADYSFSLLEDPSTTGLVDGIPFALAVGNRDQTPFGDAYGSTAMYNQYFGEARFLGRSYYGGHHGENNDNHFELFDAEGMEFVIIHIEYSHIGMPSAVGDWMEQILSTYSSRRAIIVSHNLIHEDTQFNFRGDLIYQRAKNHPNVFLMLCGHNPGEARRSDRFGGNTIQTLLADYQARINGGDGWMRLLQFHPARNQVRVRTHSPTLQQFEVDDDSQFSFPYDMGGEPFALIGTLSSVPSGSVASLPWEALDAGWTYDWYVEASDGSSVTRSPLWSFTSIGPAFVDDFEDGILDFPWRDASLCGSASEAGGQLLLSREASCEAPAIARAASPFTIAGDFVIDVGYELLDFGPPAVGSRHLALELHEAGGPLLAAIQRWRSQLGDPCVGTNDGYRVHGTDSSLCASVYLAAPDTSGAMRLEREGGLLRVRVRTAGAWSAPLLEQSTSTAPVTLALTSGSDGLLDAQLVAFDDLTVVAETVTSAGPPAPMAGSGITLLSNHPNPFNPRTTLAFVLDAPARVTARVHDSRGRTLRSWPLEDLPKGRHELHWDGRDDSGREVASGVYLWDVSTASARAARKMVLVR